MFRFPFQGLGQVAQGQFAPAGFYRPQPAIQPAQPQAIQPPVNPQMGAQAMGFNPALLAQLQQMGGLGAYQRPQLPVGLGRYNIQPISTASVGSFR